MSRSDVCCGLLSIVHAGEQVCRMSFGNNALPLWQVNFGDYRRDRTTDRLTRYCMRRDQ